MVRVRVTSGLGLRLQVRIRLRDRLRVRLRLKLVCVTVFDETDSPALTMPPGKAHSPVPLRLMANTCHGDRPPG